MKALAVIAAAANADMVLIILDGSDSDWSKVRDKIDKVIDQGTCETLVNEKSVTDKLIGDHKRLYVLNKADLANDKVEFSDKYNDMNDMLVISARKLSDIKALSLALAKRLVPLNHAESRLLSPRSAISAINHL